MRLVILLLASAVLAWALSSRVAVLLQVEQSLMPVSSGALSEHDLEELNALPPETQAVRLLEKAVNHYRGAPEEIDKRLDGWRGKMQPSQELENLQRRLLLKRSAGTGAGPEIWLARDNIHKTPETVDLLINEHRVNRPPRFHGGCQTRGGSGRLRPASQRVRLYATSD